MLTTLPVKTAIDDLLPQLELGLGVFHGGGIDADCAFAFHRARQVAETLCCAAIEIGYAEVATAVHVAVQVAKRASAQGHCAAAEQ